MGMRGRQNLTAKDTKAHKGKENIFATENTDDMNDKDASPVSARLLSLTSVNQRPPVRISHFRVFRGWFLLCAPSHALR
jgi:hypothetical protein